MVFDRCYVCPKMLTEGYESSRILRKIMDNVAQWLAISMTLLNWQSQCDKITVSCSCDPVAGKMTEVCFLIPVLDSGLSLRLRLDILEIWLWSRVNNYSNSYDEVIFEVMRHKIFGLVPDGSNRCKPSYWVWSSYLCLDFIHCFLLLSKFSIMNWMSHADVLCLSCSPPPSIFIAFYHCLNNTKGRVASLTPAEPLHHIILWFSI